MSALKQKSALFDERLADKQVIKSLIKELYERNEMSNYIVDEAGKLLAASNLEEVAVEDAEKLVEELQSKLDVVKNWLAAKAAEATAADPAAQADPPAPEQPVADPTPPAADATANDQGDPAPAADPAPADPATADKPTVDPPAADGAAPDPNATPAPIIQ